MKIFNLIKVWAALWVVLPATAFADVSAEEAKQLGGDSLTAFGAERAGNKEGTIPPYSGRAPKAPAGYDPKDPGQRPDPYGDQPLFSITAQNAEEYANKLDGMIEVFRKYPDFRMDIYPSRRDHAYPQYVIDNTIRNATSCKGTNDELKLEGCYGGIPFPIPKTGNQAMWNHLLGFQHFAWEAQVTSWVTTAAGKAVLQGASSTVQKLDYYDPANTEPNPTDSVYWRFRSTDSAPARKAGEGLLLLDSLDMVGVGRRIYQYIPGQRRVKLAPNLAYDTPSPFSGGASTMDDAQVFIGALDRYDFKLIGKKEKFIMYNSFNMTNYKACTAEKVLESRNFPNPDCVRWELHRVWVVEATLKPGFRHIYQRRMFYWDEDQPRAGAGEAYDASGKLYRVSNNASYPYYDHELGGMSETTVYMDLQTGVWAVQALGIGPGQGAWLIEPKENRFYSPEALAGEGLR